MVSTRTGRAATTAQTLSRDLAAARDELTALRAERNQLATRLAATEAARDAATAEVDRCATREHEALSRARRAESRLDRLVHRAATVARRPIRPT
ncbi:hypothetical protein GCM10009558_086670 [Virgisporangium aurantiacum]